MHFRLLGNRIGKTLFLECKKTCPTNEFTPLIIMTKTVKQFNPLHAEGMRGWDVCLDFWLIWYSGRALFFFLLSSPLLVLVLEPLAAFAAFLLASLCTAVSVVPSLQTLVLYYNAEPRIRKRLLHPFIFWVLGLSRERFTCSW